MIWPPKGFNAQEVGVASWQDSRSGLPSRDGVFGGRNRQLCKYGVHQADSRECDLTKRSLPVTKLHGIFEDLGLKYGEVLWKPQVFLISFHHSNPSTIELCLKK